MNIKKLLCLLLAGAMLLPALSACAPTTPPIDDPTDPPTEPTTEPTEPTEPAPTIEPLPKDKKYNILFIGNSYTKRYNMATEIFEPMAKAAGYDVEVTAIVNGGHTLEAFNNPNDTFGAQVAAALDPENKVKYDYVVFQEQSLRPIEDTDKFYDGARALAAKIRAAGATPVLYNHWGRKTGSPDLINLNMTNESMTWTLAGIGQAIGNELDIPVAYVGLAFYDIYTNTEIEIYDDDLYHPIYAGSFLVASTIFATIFGVDPTTVPYAGELAEVAAIVELPKAAKNAVFNTPEIPEEYQTTPTPPTEPTEPPATEPQKTVNLTKVPASKPINFVAEGTYENGDEYATLLGTKGVAASREFSTTGLTDTQKADIADIGYGISMIGIERMDDHANNGMHSLVEHICNFRYGSRQPTNYFYDDYHYDIDGTRNTSGKYTALITLNFGEMCSFEAFGFLAKNGLLGAADVYVSSDGTSWSKIPTACWDMVNGLPVTKCEPVTEKNSKDSLSITNDGCYLFDMAGAEGMYLRVGVIIGHYYNSIATPHKMVVRDFVVFGKYFSEPIAPTPTEPQPTEPAEPLYNGHLKQLPEQLCSAQNLWETIEHDSYYFDGSKWATSFPSITIPVKPGDQISATSFGPKGENGHSKKNGIRVTFFSADGVVKSLSPDETYAEFSANGYLTAPEGAVAVCIPLWEDTATTKVYLLNYSHCYENNVCLGCGDRIETEPEVTEPMPTEAPTEEPTTPIGMVNITKVPSSQLISCAVEGAYTEEQDLGETAPYATITGTKGQVASWEYSTTGLTDAQKADIADIGYGISMIGIERMDNHTSTGRPSYIMNICNHRFGSRQPTNYFFDDLHYDVNGNVDENGKYTALITLNFGKMCKFEAAGFLAKNGLLGAADIYVSADGINWTIVPTACWDMVNGLPVTKCDKVSAKDSKDGLSITNDGCYLFDMAGTEGMYLRVGVVIGHYYNDVATPNQSVVRDIVVFGEYLSEAE